MRTYHHGNSRSCAEQEGSLRADVLDGVAAAPWNVGAIAGSLKQAVTVARTQGAAFWELRAVLSLAPVFVQRRAHVEARGLLTEALSRMPAGADTAETRRAEALRG